MKSIFHISSIIIIIGLVLAAPVSKHYCNDMIVQEMMQQKSEHSCCEHERMPKDCCHDELHFCADDNFITISFTTVEIGNISDFWIENPLADFNMHYDLYKLSKNYINDTVSPPKNEVELYKYVQSYLI